MSIKSVYCDQDRNFNLPVHDYNFADTLNKEQKTFTFVYNVKKRSPQKFEEGKGRFLKHNNFK